jgi:hypothetical protein
LGLQSHPGYSTPQVVFVSKRETRRFLIPSGTAEKVAGVGLEKKTGLVRESFVGDADTMIDVATAHTPNADERP